MHLKELHALENVTLTFKNSFRIKFHILAVNLISRAAIYFDLFELKEDCN